MGNERIVEGLFKFLKENVNNDDIGMTMDDSNISIDSIKETRYDLGTVVILSDKGDEPYVIEDYNDEDNTYFVTQLETGDDGHWTDASNIGKRIGETTTNRDETDEIRIAFVSIDNDKDSFSDNDKDLNKAIKLVGGIGKKMNVVSHDPDYDITAVVSSNDIKPKDVNKMAKIGDPSIFDKKYWSGNSVDDILSQIKSYAESELDESDELPKEVWTVSLDGDVKSREVDEDSAYAKLAELSGKSKDEALGLGWKVEKLSNESIIEFNVGDKVIFRMKGEKNDNSGEIVDIKQSSDEPLQTYVIKDSKGNTVDLRMYNSKAQNFEKLENESKTNETKDYVECSNCGFVGLAELGTDSCPECGSTGTLAWADEENQEVPDDYLDDSVSEQDDYKVVARGISDEETAKRIAADKKGQVVTDENDEKKFMIIVKEGYEERGKRDGTGPYKDSAMRQTGDTGMRKRAGEECPNEGDDLEVPETVEVTDELVAEMIENIPELADFDREQVIRGLEVEQEHMDTIDSDMVKVAGIALDHLKEIPDYYTRLDAMEQEAKAPEPAEEGRGKGKGVGGQRQGDGGPDMCICPTCGREYEHVKGETCNKKICDDCGVALVGKKKASESIDIGDLPKKVKNGKKYKYVYVDIEHEVDRGYITLSDNMSDFDIDVEVCRQVFHLSDKDIVRNIDRNSHYDEEGEYEDGANFASGSEAEYNRGNNSMKIMYDDGRFTSSIKILGLSNKTGKKASESIDIDDIHFGVNDIYSKYDEGEIDANTAEKLIKDLFNKHVSKKKASEGKEEIQTAQGPAKFVKTEVEDDNGNWNDNYNVKDGYYVIHRGKEHDVYKLSEKVNEDEYDDENFEDIERLRNIQEEISELIGEADTIISDIDKVGSIYDRAKSYWMAHIKTALYNDTEYLGGSMVTMEDTIEELEEFDADEDVEEGKTVPKPKVGDGVERTDMSKCCGNVVKVVSDNEVEVDWGNNEKSVEKIEDLALVSRNESVVEPDIDEIETERGKAALENIKKFIANKGNSHDNPDMYESLLDEIDQVITPEAQILVSYLNKYASNDLSKQKESTLEKKLKKQSRGKCVFQSDSSKVKDDKDHFPINSLSQARNALSRVAQYSSSPSWYKGTLAGIQKAVRSAVKKAYPSIEVSDSKLSDDDVKLMAERKIVYDCIQKKKDRTVAENEFIDVFDFEKEFLTDEENKKIGDESESMLDEKKEKSKVPSALAKKIYKDFEGYVDAKKKDPKIKMKDWIADKMKNEK